MLQALLVLQGSTSSLPFTADVEGLSSGLLEFKNSTRKSLT